MALIEFYGEECPHCLRMAPRIAQLEKELGVTVDRREVWHHEENARMFDKVDRGNCGGVPFYYNTESKKFLCGESSYDELRAWAEGK